MSELDIIRAIQSIHNEWLDFIFQGITMLGESTIILIFILSIYWSFNKKLGEYMAYSFLTSALLNNFVKNIFKAPRPIGEEGIRSLRVQTATGYSFPSGHSQSASSTFLAFAIYNEKKIIKIISVMIVLLVGISRLYLGVHYPKDVVVGILFGGLTAEITCYLFQNGEKKGVLYLGTLLLFSVGIFNLSPDFIKSLGAFIGFILGRQLEISFVKFETEINFSYRIIRIIVGSLLLLYLQFILKEAFHSHPFELWIRHVIITFTGFGVIPLVFKRMR